MYKFFLTDSPTPKYETQQKSMFKTLLGSNVLKEVISAKMVKIIKFLFFAQKVSSGMGALCPKFLGG